MWSVCYFNAEEKRYIPRVCFSTNGAACAFAAYMRERFPLESIIVLPYYD